MNLFSKIINKSVYVVKRSFLEIRHLKPSRNSSLSEWAHYIDKTRKLNGSRGFYSEQFGNYILRTPWLPMLRVQLRAFFRSNEYQFDLPYNSTIIDLGANIGIGSIYFHEYYRPLNLIAVEADPYLYETFLKPNVESGKVHCTLINKACSSLSGQTFKFKSTGLDSGHLAVDGDISVKTISLDDLMEPYDVVDLLKVDVEGAEYDVLINSKTLTKAKNLYIEVEYQAYSRKPYGKLISYLQDLGYEVILRASMPQLTPKQSFSTQSGIITSYIHIYAKYTGEFLGI